MAFSFGGKVGGGMAPTVVGGRGRVVSELYETGTDGGSVEIYNKRNDVGKNAPPKTRMGN